MSKSDISGAKNWLGASGMTKHLCRDYSPLSYPTLCSNMSTTFKWTWICKKTYIGGSYTIFKWAYFTLIFTHYTYLCGELCHYHLGQCLFLTLGPHKWHSACTRVLRCCWDISWETQLYLQIGTVNRRSQRCRSTFTFSAKQINTTIRFSREF